MYAKLEKVGNSQRKLPTLYAFLINMILGSCD